MFTLRRGSRFALRLWSAAGLLCGATQIFRSPSECTRTVVADDGVAVLELCVWAAALRLNETWFPEVGLQLSWRDVLGAPAVDAPWTGTAYAQRFAGLDEAGFLEPSDGTHPQTPLVTLLSNVSQLSTEMVLRITLDCPLASRPHVSCSTTLDMALPLAEAPGTEVTEGCAAAPRRFAPRSAKAIQRGEVWRLGGTSVCAVDVGGGSCQGCTDAINQTLLTVLCEEAPRSRQIRLEWMDHCLGVIVHDGSLAVEMLPTFLPPLSLAPLDESAAASFVTADGDVLFAATSTPGAKRVSLRRHIRADEHLAQLFTIPEDGMCCNRNWDTAPLLFDATPSAWTSLRDAARDCADALAQECTAMGSWPQIASTNTSRYVVLLNASGQNARLLVTESWDASLAVRAWQDATGWTVVSLYRLGDAAARVAEPQGALSTTVFGRRAQMRVDPSARLLLDYPESTRCTWGSRPVWAPSLPGDGGEPLQLSLRANWTTPPTLLLVRRAPSRGETPCAGAWQTVPTARGLVLSFPRAMLEHGCRLVRVFWSSGASPPNLTATITQGDDWAVDILPCAVREDRAVSLRARCWGHAPALPSTTWNACGEAERRRCDGMCVDSSEPSCLPGQDADAGCAPCAGPNVSLTRDSRCEPCPMRWRRFNASSCTLETAESRRYLLDDDDEDSDDDATTELDLDMNFFALEDECREGARTADWLDADASSTQADDYDGPFDTRYSAANVGFPLDLQALLVPDLGGQGSAGNTVVDVARGLRFRSAQGRLSPLFDLALVLPPPRSVGRQSVFQPLLRVRRDGVGGEQEELIYWLPSALANDLVGVTVVPVQMDVPASTQNVAGRLALLLNAEGGDQSVVVIDVDALEDGSWALRLSDVEATRRPTMRYLIADRLGVPPSSLLSISGTRVTLPPLEGATSVDAWTVASVCDDTAALWLAETLTVAADGGWLQPGLPLELALFWPAQYALPAEIGSEALSRALRLRSQPGHLARYVRLEPLSWTQGQGDIFLVARAWPRRDLLATALGPTQLQFLQGFWGTNPPPVLVQLRVGQGAPRDVSTPLLQATWQAEVEWLHQRQELALAGTQEWHLHPVNAAFVTVVNDEGSDTVFDPLQTRSWTAGGGDAIVVPNAHLIFLDGELLLHGQHSPGGAAAAQAGWPAPALAQQPAGRRGPRAVQSTDVLLVMETVGALHQTRQCRALTSELAALREVWTTEMHPDFELPDDGLLINWQDSLVLLIMEAGEVTAWAQLTVHPADGISVLNQDFVRANPSYLTLPEPPLGERFWAWCDTAYQRQFTRAARLRGRARRDSFRAALQQDLPARLASWARYNVERTGIRRPSYVIHNRALRRQVYAWLSEQWMQSLPECWLPAVFTDPVNGMAQIHADAPAHIRAALQEQWYAFTDARRCSARLRGVIRSVEGRGGPEDVLVTLEEYVPADPLESTDLTAGLAAPQATQPDTQGAACAFASPRCSRGDPDDDARNRRITRSRRFDKDGPWKTP